MVDAPVDDGSVWSAWFSFGAVVVLSACIGFAGGLWASVSAFARVCSWG